MRPIPHEGQVPGRSEFGEVLRASESYTAGSAGRKQYIDGNVPRLHRVFCNMLLSDVSLTGPTLDVASGTGLLFPALRRFLPEMLPYHIAELQEQELGYDGERIPCVKFECEKDTLPHDDQTFGCVLFFDCLEHLLVDPFWTLLEFNRVLRPGGRLLIATPNATASFRMLNLLRGLTPTTETQYKPASLYQRHNREWTPGEIGAALDLLGFDDLRYSTNHQLLGDAEKQALRLLRREGFTSLPDSDFGPETFVVARKVEHKTLRCDLPKEERWPEFLYTGFDAYRRRPKVFPVVVGDDYS
jgi:SAM-dependent methyltransferase